MKSVKGSVGYLKWTQDRYAKSLARDFKGVEMQAHPVEDFARATITLEDEAGRELIVEASTSWAYVGPGPAHRPGAARARIRHGVLLAEPRAEGLPLPRDHGGQGEDLVEKQNAEQGLMPIVEDEAGTYGYVGENRHMVDCFRHGRTPIETFHDGVEVVKMVMALYKSAETGQTVRLPDDTLETYVPVPARTGAERWPTEPYDAIIVGSGAGGGMSAYHLTKAGLKVLMLEAGRNYDPRSETPMFNTTPRRRCAASRTPDKPFGFYDATVDGGWQVPNEPYTVAEGSEPFIWWRPRMLGGRTNHWGRISLRFGPSTSSPTAATAWATTGRSPTRTSRPGTTRPRS